MQRVVGAVLLAAGIVLLIFGAQARGSFASKAKETFTGTPTNETTWYLVGGAVCAAAGVGLLVFKGK
jgi:hypothetical protein